VNAVGFGDVCASLKVFIGNRPPLDECALLQTLRPLPVGEIGELGVSCGNHWRKIFNCYAKIAFTLDTQGYCRWQDYRDCRLLQQGSAEQLRFDGTLMAGEGVSVICGRTHAQSLCLPEDLSWLDQDFAISVKQRIIVSPYFDYRQLSNVKIQRLCELIQTLY
jgi:hypothetical protein